MAFLSSKKYLFLCIPNYAQKSIFNDKGYEFSFKSIASQYVPGYFSAFQYLEKIEKGGQWIEMG